MNVQQIVDVSLRKNGFLVFTDDYFRLSSCSDRGIARNLLRGDKREGLGAEVPQRGPGAELRWVWGRKPETHAEYSTEQST